MKYRNMKYPVIDSPMVFNNVRVTPSVSNKWHRKIHKGRALNSSILIDGFVISIAYFTSDNNVSGYTCAVHKDRLPIAHGDMMNGNYIKANDIADAERQVLVWFFANYY